MNNLLARSAALSLVATFASAPALAVPLFDLNAQTVGVAPTFGSSFGLVGVDDGAYFTSASPAAFGAGLTKQLYVDNTGSTSLGGWLGLYGSTVPAFGATVSLYQFTFTAAVATNYTFAYNVLTNQAPGVVGDNFAFGIVNAGVRTILGTVFSNAAFVPSTSGFAYESGIKGVAFDVAPGTYTVEFVMGTSQFDCRTGGPACIPGGVIIAGAIPEPRTYAMFAAGLLVLLALGRRRKLRD